ncbi:MAG: AAA family ATPase [Bacteroidetes bacterium]|nr:AAA family ATPase [Bacteroidota bacterium]
MSESIIHLKKLKQLLQIERDEDFKIYQIEFLKASIETRRKNGVTWYPIKINSEELGYADYLQLEIERTSHIDLPHQFSSGKNISLFSNQNTNEHVEISATIKASFKNKLKIIVHTDELPDWCYDGKLGINIQFDENSYNEMQLALDRVIKDQNSRVAELRKIFYTSITPNFTNESDSIFIQNLNQSQNKAIKKSLASKDVAIIHGPPGTGKTTTLVQAIRICTQTEKQVLVCAPTNTAVDLLTEKLKEIGVNVLRMGHPARISEELINTSVDGQIQNHKNYYEIKNLRKNAEEYFKMAGKYKRVFGKEEAQQRASYYNEAKTCLKEARLIEDFIVDDLFNSAQVICCTPVTSVNKHLNKKIFNTLFFDEASQALEPLVWIPLLKCNRIIMAGDNHQLPPVVKSLQAQKEGLAITLLDKCINFKNAVSLLNRQYRMNTPIMKFSNAYFYNNELIADETVSTQLLINDINEVNSSFNSPIEFVDTAGCGLEENQHPETLSSYNIGEANLIFNHFSQLINWYSNYKQNDKLTIGIISPYKEQVNWLKENIKEISINHLHIEELRINTIDGFQGQECDVIYISLVRSNSEQIIGFLNDIRRMNVAITRAKKKLIVVGDSATLSVNKFYESFISYCDENKFYKSAWEFLNL